MTIGSWFNIMQPIRHNVPRRHVYFESIYITTVKHAIWLVNPEISES